MGDAVSGRRVVCVRQFLLPGREKAFAEVFSLHRRLASTRDGFVSLRRLKHVDAADGHENEAVVILEFDDAEKLSAWRASEEHRDIASRYQALWARDPVTEFFAVEE
jgi:heme-degrading monooxygenase HmoA